MQYTTKGETNGKEGKSRDEDEQVSNEEARKGRESSQEEVREKEQVDSLTIAWCDNGLVDGMFMQGVTDVILRSGINIVTTLRSSGNQIARQRERVITTWYEQNKSEWILWVDSDVVISPDKFKILWDAKDAIERPIVNGVYFTSDTPEESLMVPWATLFNWTSDKTKLARVHPMPKNKLIKIGAAGMGFTLMHRNAIKTIKEKLGAVLLFTEVNGFKAFTGEDIYFYSLCDRAGVPVYAHTGATVPHMKRFSFDEMYYDAFTTAQQPPLHSKKKRK